MRLLFNFVVLLLLFLFVSSVPSTRAEVTCNATRRATFSNGATCPECTCRGNYCYGVWHPTPNGPVPYEQGCVDAKFMAPLPNGCINMLSSVPHEGNRNLICQCDTNNCNSQPTPVLNDVVPSNVRCMKGAGNDTCIGQYCYTEGADPNHRACGFGVVELKSPTGGPCYVNITSMDNQEFCISNSVDYFPHCFCHKDKCNTPGLLTRGAAAINNQKKSNTLICHHYMVTDDAPTTVSNASYCYSEQWVNIATGQAVSERSDCMGVFTSDPNVFDRQLGCFTATGAFHGFSYTQCLCKSNRCNAIARIFHTGNAAVALTFSVRHLMLLSIYVLVGPQNPVLVWK